MRYGVWREFEEPCVNEKRRHGVWHEFEEACVNASVGKVSGMSLKSHELTKTVGTVFLHEFEEPAVNHNRGKSHE